MASSSGIRPAALKGSVSTSRLGAVAAWWRAHKGDLAKEAIIALVVGVEAPPNRGGIDYKESHARAAEEVRR